MNIHICDGPKQETEGTWYCPFYPDWDDDDCPRCKYQTDAAIDREVERRVEARCARLLTPEKDTWGG